MTPNLVTSTHPGDLFVRRNVGNLIPPARGDGASTGDLSEASAIEYAVLVLKVSEIIICGHSGCGAMKAITGHGGCPDAPNLNQWLEHAQPAARRMEQETRRREQEGGADGKLQPYDRVSQLNVLVQLEHLASYPVVRERVAAGALRLHGWWFDVASASMHAYNSTDDRFEPIDRRLVKRLAARSAAVRNAMTSPHVPWRSGKTVHRSGASRS